MAIKPLKWQLQFKLWEHTLVLCFKKILKQAWAALN